MFDDPNNEFKHKPLDPELLSTPFQTHTNWHVLTGTVSAGKSTLIELLADKGFHTVQETARLYIQQEESKGRTVDEIHADGKELQRGIKDLQVRVECSLQPEEHIFLDRAVPDILVWYRVRGMDPNQMLPDCFHHRYATIFMLDSLPFQSDVERVEGIASITEYLEEWHTRDYAALGYSIVRVPVLPPEDRLAFVLEDVSERGLM